MRKYIFISVGGAFGAVMRFAVGDIQIWDTTGAIPFSTLMINTLGCFALAFFLTLAYEVLVLDADIRLGVATGLLGSFTTFSTFCQETYRLAAGGALFSALLYMALSILLGLAAVYVGIVFGKASTSRRMGQTGDTVMDEGEGL